MALRQSQSCEACQACPERAGPRGSDQELFDRGYGRSVQPLVGTLEHGVSQQLATLSAGNEGNTLGAEIARRAALPPANGQRTDGPLPAMVPSKKTAVRAIAPI
jgi:hypothetical protein